VYALTMPPGRTTVSVSSDGGFNVSASLIAAPASTCELPERECITGADRTTSTTTGVNTETVAFSNTGTSDVPVFLVVDNASTSPTGLFSVSQATSAVVPGEDCESAESLLGDGGIVVGQTTFGYDNDFPNSVTNVCTGSVGRDRVYRVTVPSNRRLVAAIQPDAGFDPRLDIMVGLQNCRRRLCSGFPINNGTGLLDSVAFTNGETTDVEAFIVVDSTSLTATTGAGNFDIGAAIQPALPGDTCGTAIPVANGTMLSGTTANLTREYGVPTTANGCNFTGGPDIVYTATVPAGQTFTASTTITAGDLVLNLIQGPVANCRPAPLSCLASSDSSPESVSWRNNGTTAQQVFLVLSQYSTSPTATVPAYTLSVTIN
jgi:hypothetical protein